MDEIKYKKEQLKFSTIYSTTINKIKFSTTNYKPNNLRNHFNKSLKLALNNNTISKFEKLSSNKDSKYYKLFLKEHKNKNKNFTVGKYTINKDDEKKKIKNGLFKFPTYNSVSKIKKNYMKIKIILKVISNLKDKINF